MATYVYKYTLTLYTGIPSKDGHLRIQIYTDTIYTVIPRKDGHLRIQIYTDTIYRYTK